MEEPTPRLMIEKVILENFKSYAGIREIGPFHKSFTAVVGPNGSGKSNMLECLLFAFGKRARQMRLKKLSELIHSSKKFPSLNYTRVSVYFQDIIDTEDGNYSVVPNSQLILSRSVNKASHSEYKLNGRDSTYEEITRVLKQRGIDLKHNRFLILQGEVEQIATMKPKAPITEDGKQPSTTGLLEYLEDIIGTNEYVPQIESAEKGLEDVNEDITMQKLKVEEAEKALKELEAPKDEALKFIECEKQRYNFRNLKYYLERYKHHIKYIEVNTQRQQLEGEWNKLRETYAQKRQEHEEVIQQSRLKKKESSKVAKQMNDVKLSFQAKFQEIQQLENIIKKCEKTLGELQSDEKNKEKRMVELDVTFNGIEEAVPKLTDELQQYSDEFEAVNNEFQQIAIQVKAQTKELQKALQKAEDNMHPVKNQYEECKQNLELTETKIGMIINSEQQSTMEIQQCENVIKETEEGLVHIDQEIATLSTQQAQKIQQQQKLQSDIEQQKGELRHLAQTLAQRRQELEEMSRSLEQSQGQDRMYNEIMQAGRLNELKGVIGRLGELATIDMKYDIAVSSSVQRLENIVVETVADANAVLDFVRQRRLGRVTLLALDKISQNIGNRHRQPYQVPDPSTVRLFDLIQCENPRFTPLFYYAMGDTLVTDTIEQARRVALGQNRHRVVTLDGNIINPSGEMQGFSQPKRGRMAIRQGRQAVMNSNKIAEVQRDAAELEVRVNEMRRKLEKMQEFHSGVLKEATGVGQLVEIKKSERRDKATSLQIIRQRLENLSRLSKPEESMEELRVLQNQQQRALDRTAQLMQRNEYEITQIKQEIDKVGGEEYRNLRDNKDRLKNLVNTRTKELSKMESQKKQVGQDLAKIYKQHQELLKQKENTSKQLEECKQKHSEYETSLQQTSSQYETLEAQLKVIQAEAQQFDQAEQQARIEFGKLKEERELLKEKIETTDGQLRQINQRLEHWTAQIQENRQKYHETIREYDDLLGSDMAVDEFQEEESEAFQSKRPKDENELEHERRRLSYNVNKDFVLEELEVLNDKYQTVCSIESLIEDELEKARPNLGVIAEYRSRRDDKGAKDQALMVILANEADLRREYNELKAKRLHEFTIGFTQISNKLREMYQMITRGGDAELEFADTTDPFSEGIVFTVRPPNKSWKKMANLSGGEKTLSSLALVFALHHYKPTALYVMDEVDAALDYQNVSVIANYIKSRTKNAQFIVVSLRYQMFELADKLVGVYKTHDVTQTITISPCALKFCDSTNPIIQQTVNNITVSN